MSDGGAVWCYYAKLPCATDAAVNGSHEDTNQQSWLAGRFQEPDKGCFRACSSFAEIVSSISTERLNECFAVG